MDVLKITNTNINSHFIYSSTKLYSCETFILSMGHYCYKFQHKPHYGDCTNKNVPLGPLDFKVNMIKSQMQ